LPHRRETCGLRDVVHRPALQRLDRRFGGALRQRADDDDRRRPPFEDVVERCQAIFAGHLQVERNDVGDFDVALSRERVDD
jgi:hypothetical protein